MTKKTPAAAGAAPAALPAGYAGIHGGIVEMLDAARQAAARSVNALMTASYWEIGRRIVEAEQQGKRRAGYGEQFLMVEAKPSACDPTYISPQAETVRKSATAFANAANAELEKWRARLSEMDGKAVIWGAGSKGITFANALGDAGKPLAALVDLNTRKHGLIAPGIALPVVAPEALKNLKPDLVLISNALYESEITEQVKALGLNL